MSDEFVSQIRFQRVHPWHAGECHVESPSCCRPEYCQPGTKKGLCIIRLAIVIKAHVNFYCMDEPRDDFKYLVNENLKLDIRINRVGLGHSLMKLGKGLQIVILRNYHLKIDKGITLTLNMW